MEVGAQPCTWAGASTRASIAGFLCLESNARFAFASKRAFVRSGLSAFRTFLLPLYTQGRAAGKGLHTTRQGLYSEPLARRFEILR